jgi:hypothetical protein
VINRLGVGTIADISHKIVDIRKPSANVFASVLAAGILRPARRYSNTRKALIAPYDIAKFPEVSANAPCILIVSAAAPIICKSTNKRWTKSSVSNLVA